MSNHATSTSKFSSRILGTFQPPLRALRVLRGFTLCLLLGLALLPGACATRSPASDASDKKVKVGIVFDIGGKDDRSFNAAAYQGVLRAKKELPITLRDVEPGDPTSIEPAL